MSTNEDTDDIVFEIEKYMEEKPRKEDPDYSNIVYCDKHLGVKMRLAKSWGSVEYGDSAVDANANYLWYCPKPGCDRHYAPMIFGYYSSEQGRTPRTDGKQQPRGNHPGLPFMYIGKIGNGRVYKCPLYKCEEHGPEVAGSVAEEEVQAPPDELAGLNNAQRKRAAEMAVFQSFAAVSGLSIDEGSPVNCDPDYPDILCTISGQKCWFELGQIIHEDVAEKINPKRRTLDGGFSYDQEKPFVELVSSKAAKKYVTEGAPVDLILHFDLRFGIPNAARRLCEKHANILAALTSKGPFSRVWVFDDFNKVVIWRL